jgi:hypothetical protein
MVKFQIEVLGNALTYDEAKQLYQELRKIFEKDSSPYIVPSGPIFRGLDETSIPYKVTCASIL